jgi:RNA polymerase sigma-70 factor (ECF subfamily)
VAVNRAVAVAEVEGPDAALTLLDSLDLENYYLFHTVRADHAPPARLQRRGGDRL